MQAFSLWSKKSFCPPTLAYTCTILFYGEKRWENNITMTQHHLGLWKRTPPNCTYSYISLHFWKCNRAKSVPPVEHIASTLRIISYITCMRIIWKIGKQELKCTKKKKALLMSCNQTWQQTRLLFNICFRILGYILNSHLFPFPFKDNFWQFMTICSPVNVSLKTRL